MIGDPSGKNSERVAMLAEDVEKNAVKLTENVNRIFHNHAEYIHKDKSSLNPHRFGAIFKDFDVLLLLLIGMKFEFELLSLYC